MKYDGAWVARVNNPHMAPVCVNKLTNNGFDKSNDFHGMGNYKNIKLILFNNFYLNVLFTYCLLTTILFSYV